jgi:hypothetical protein
MGSAHTPENPALGEILLDEDGHPLHADGCDVCMLFTMPTDPEQLAAWKEKLRRQAAERDRDQQAEALEGVVPSFVEAAQRAEQAEAALATMTQQRDTARQWAMRLEGLLAEERVASAALLETGYDEPLMTEPGNPNAYTFWFCGGTIRRGHAEDCPWQRFVALAQHAPAADARQDQEA